MKIGIAAVVLAACGSDSWLASSKILVDGFDELNLDCRTGPCDHDENTDLAIYDGATYLVHRTAESQVLGPNSSLRVYRSDDHGGHFTLLAVIPAPSDRDLRDPCFYEIDGQLAIKAITRLPVTSSRDSNVDSISVNTISSDGMTWTQGAQVYGVSEDTPLETELVFMPSGNLIAFVRMDGTDDELLGSMGRLRTKVCTAPPPYSAFDCTYELDGARLDGPVAFFWKSRLFFVAREHYLEVANRKRTALYEIHMDSETGPFSFTMHGEFPSAGDTSYAGVVPISGAKFLVSYYSSNLAQDPPWARAILGPTDIWQATIDLSKL